MDKCVESDQLFSTALNVKKNDLVAFTGSGGKTSLMFRLAFEAKARGEKVLVATTTKIRIPEPDQYDFIDFLGNVFLDEKISEPGIYVNAPICKHYGKADSIDMDLLNRQRQYFDLVLVEADGAAAKPLKGWETYEPVIPDETTKTIGILDIQTIGKCIGEEIVHRLDLFCKLTGAIVDTPVTLGHYEKIIKHENGLFQYSKVENILYLNKVETQVDGENVDLLIKNLDIKVVAGSLQNGVLYACY